MVIARTDRVSTVIGRDESLIDVFASLSPAFERLRSPGMRKVMARLVTVEQAARMAGVDADELVSRLNGHEAARDVAANTMTEADNVAAMDTGSKPAALAAIDNERIVVLDVRDELRAGREPFSLIMGALRSVPEGGALVIRAIFEPVPLYAVMKRQGLEHWTEELAADDWRVSFFPPTAEEAAQEKGSPGSTTPGSVDDAADPEGDVIVLDVRGMEPPEPMMRTLAALEELPVGATLLQINVRVPQFLLPMLEERGFTYHVREQEQDLVRVFIRHGNQ
ncbi:MAG TPA: DUF2249 domain-containing protein [Longimicrobiales bacterium]|nr:DUF2249 domain-containing protein [Longimicrobiales bacterium]